KEFLYWSDDGDLMAIRINQWKVAFKEQEHTGLDVWKREFANLRAPTVYNIRSDPFERGPESFDYGRWMAERMFLFVPAGRGRRMVVEFQGIPGPPEARELQPRRGDAKAVHIP